MGLNGISRGFGHGMGKLIGGTCKVLFWPGRVFSKVRWKSRSTFPSAKVRSIVVEELTRLMGAEALAEEKIEQRLKVIAETILAFQERLDELAVRGPISEADMFKAMGSFEAAAFLTDDERVVLANVFRQNIKIQKPELIDTVVEQDSLKVTSS